MIPIGRAVQGAPKSKVRARDYAGGPANRVVRIPDQPFPSPPQPGLGNNHGFVPAVKRCACPRHPQSPRAAPEAGGAGRAMAGRR